MSLYSRALAWEKQARLMNSWLRPYLLAFATYAVLITILFWPLLRHPFTTVVDDYDGLFITWTINWVQHVWISWPVWEWGAQLYHAPIFTPLPWTYTFSDPFLTAAVIGLPVWLLTNQPIASVTINTLLAILLTAYFTFCFVKELGQSNRVSWLAGLWIGLGVAHLSFLGHLHMLMVQWIPLGAYAAVKFAHTQRSRFVGLFLISFLLQILNSPFSGYLFLICTAPVLGQKSLWLAIKKNWRFIVVAVLIAIALCLWFYHPFLQAGQLYHSYRSIRDAAHFALSVNDLVSPLRLSRLYWLIWPFVLISSWRLFRLIRKSKWKQIFLLQNKFLIVGLISTILSLGPVLKWAGETVKIPFPIPLPYVVGYYFLPGFSAFRTPSRWLMAADFCLVIFLVLAIPKKYFSGFIVSAVALVIIWETGAFRHFVTVPDFAHYPPVFSQIAQLPKGNVIYIPPLTYAQPGSKQEVYRMLFSLKDQSFSHKMYNGYSGFAPQNLMDEMDRLNDQPFTPTLAKTLDEHHIRYVVIQKKYLQEKDQPFLNTLIPQALYNDEAWSIFDRNLFK